MIRLDLPSFRAGPFRPVTQCFVRLRRFWKRLCERPHLTVGSLRETRRLQRAHSHQLVCLLSRSQLQHSPKIRSTGSSAPLPAESGRSPDTATALPATSWPAPRSRSASPDCSHPRTASGTTDSVHSPADDAATPRRSPSPAPSRAGSPLCSHLHLQRRCKCPSLSRAVPPLVGRGCQSRQPSDFFPVPELSPAEELHPIHPGAVQPDALEPEQL